VYWPETGFEEMIGHVLEPDLGLTTADSHLRVERYAEVAGSRLLGETRSLSFALMEERGVNSLPNVLQGVVGA